MAIPNHSSCLVHLLEGWSLVLPRIGTRKTALSGGVSYYMVTHTYYKVKLLFSLFIVVGAFIVSPTPTYSATTTVAINFANIASSTTLYTISGLPTNTACSYQLGGGTTTGQVLAISSSGTCNTNDFLVGDNSIRVVPNFDSPIKTDYPYTGKIVVGSDVYAISLFTWNGSSFNSSYSGITQCTTCTRIVDIISPIEEEVYFITPDVSAEYYVNSDDVEDTDNVYIKFTYNSVKSIAYAQTEETNYSGGVEAKINQSNNSYFFNASINTLTATGTYNGTYQIVERVTPAWWQFWQTWDYQDKVLAEKNYRFFMYSETDAEEIARIYQNEQNRIYAESTACMDDYSSTDCLKERIDATLNALLYAPPLGYAYYLVNDILLATTTATSTLLIEVSFPSTSPAYGKTIDLDISGEIGNTVTFLENTPLPFNTGSVMDNLMDYWIWFLRIMLGFYILKRVLSMYDISLSYNPDAGNYQKRGDITPNYQGKGNRKLKIKSYD